MQLPADFQTVETRCGREGHTRPRGPSESPDGVDPNIRRTRTTQRDGHNSGVKIWSLCSVSSILSHANLSNPYNKVRGECFSKEVFLCLPSCVFIMRRLFMRLSFCVRPSLLLLSRYDMAHDYITLAVPPWATETVLSPLDGGWWGHGIARAFTRCMMKKKSLKNNPKGFIYN